MNIFFISPIGKTSYLLFDTFIPTFEKEGHRVVGSIEEADVIFFDLYSFLGEYDEEVLNKFAESEKPIIYFDATDYGGMSKERWSRLVYDEVAKDRKIIYFMRKMDKAISYPGYVYPIEHVIECDFQLVSKEELFNREYDFCFAGNKSPQRVSVVDGLLSAGLKGLVYWTTENPKLSHGEWIAMHRQAKLFLTADGGGYSDERVQQLFSVAGILKQKNNHLQDKPLISPFMCLEINERLDSDDIYDLKYLLGYDEQLYTMYRRGYEHAKRFYSEEYRANYILEMLRQNNIQ